MTKKYRVQAEVFWRCSNDRYRTVSAIKTFIGRTQADVYSYLTYYCGHNGMSDVKMIEEGEINEA